MNPEVILGTGRSLILSIHSFLTLSDISCNRTLKDIYSQVNNNAIFTYLEISEFQITRTKGITSH